MGVGPGRAVAFVLDDNMDFDDLLAHTGAELAAAAGAAVGAVQPLPAAPQAGFEFVAQCGAIAAGYGSTGQGGCGLLCSVREQGQEYLLRFVYDPQQLSAATAADWLEYYGRFIEGITEGLA